MINRRDILTSGVAAGAALLSSSGKTMAYSNEERFWREIETAFPASSGLVNMVNSGGGACPKTTLDIISKYQKIAAAGGEDTSAELTSLKESGSSETIRQMMANAFGCRASEIALMRNAMEGLAIGLLGVDMKRGDEVLTTRGDYDSCIEIIRQREARDGIHLKLVDIPMPAQDDDEIVAAFEEACTSRTRLILMCHMFNKNGQILPVRRISDMARRKGIMTIVDGAQSIGHIDFEISDLGCDVFAASLHKWFYAPRGTGILYVRREMIEKVWPIWASWSGKPADSIEKYEDYGTVSKAVSVALPSVFKLNRQIGAPRKEKRLRFLRDSWLDPVLQTGRVSLLTSLHPSQSCAITAFRVDGINPDTLADELRDRHDILIGSIHLPDKPEFVGNYVAADLTNTPHHLARFVDAFLSVLNRR